MTLQNVKDAVLGYARNVLVAVDQLANTLLGGLPADTISYRAAVYAKRGNRFACVLCRFLDLFQDHHCEKTLIADDHQRLLWGEAIERGETPL